MIIVAGTLAVDPARVDLAMEAAKAVMVETHKEPGNHEYVFSIDPLQLGLLRIFEIWESEEDISAHFATKHMSAFSKRLGEFGVTGSSINKYEISSSGPLH